ncbi:hypothetical protein ACIBHX_08965 [Nonomuraea sp. NPDC050536]|uniref:hypothetical protein n=1 Tax=Nonomuraea sp. NPDC050536 TaxID=3364366 RepID=UPI0037C691BC
MTKNDGLAQFAADHAEWFARSAYLLTGDPERARDLAIGALVTTGRRWSMHRWNRPVEAVLSALYRAYLTTPAEPPAGFPLAGMSPLGRVAVVAQFHDSLDPQRAAQLVGTWMPGALHEETERVRVTHPHIFDLGEESTAGPRPHEATEAPGDSPWAAPWQADGLAAPPSPWTASPSPAPFTPSPALVRLAAELPAAVPVDVAQTAPRLVLRRRLVKRSVFTTLSLAGAGAFVAVTILALNAIADRADMAVQQADAPFSEPDLTPTELDPTPTTEDAQPERLPERLDEPISRAYQGFCNSDAPYDTRKPPECAQWRLVGKSGTEWRLDAAQTDKPHQGTYVPEVGVSQDGRRIAYLDNQNDYVVRDLATGKYKTFAIQLHGSDPEFVSSRNGRYFAVNFLQSGVDSPMLDFTKGTTTYGAWTMAITDDGKRVIDESMESEASSDTKIKLAGRRFRVDAEVGISGAALSPDGRTLAVADDERVITLDTRTGHVTRIRKLVDGDEEEIDQIERWLDADEVVVRTEDDEDAVSLVSVNVRTGKTRKLDADGLEYGDVLGAYAE